MESQIIKTIPKTLHQEIESNICAFNKYLKKKVGQMTWIQLLRNCHPAERPGYAWRLYKVKRIDYDTLQTIAPKNDQ